MVVLIGLITQQISNSFLVHSSIKEKEEEKKTRITCVNFLAGLHCLIEVIESFSWFWTFSTNGIKLVPWPKQGKKNRTNIYLFFYRVITEPPLMNQKEQLPLAWRGIGNGVIDKFDTFANKTLCLDVIQFTFIFYFTWKITRNKTEEQKNQRITK